MSPIDLPVYYLLAMVQAEFGERPIFVTSGYQKRARGAAACIIPRQLAFASRGILREGERSRRSAPILSAGIGRPK